MNAYQRGNRDGLLSFAKWAREMADLHGAEVQKMAGIVRNPVTSNQKHAASRIEQQSLVRMVAFHDAAVKAEAMANALPVDEQEQVD